MYSNTEDTQTIDEVLFKRHSAPLLYKYCNAETAQNILRSKTIRFSNSNKFNDFFDAMSHTEDYDVSSGDFLVDDPHEELLRMQNNKITHEEYASECMSACFSLSELNILMWSHYAENGTGVCIGFHPSKLFNRIALDASNIAVIHEFSPVKYHVLFPTAYKTLDNNQFTRLIEGLREI